MYKLLLHGLSFVLLIFFTSLFWQCIYPIHYKKLLHDPNAHRVHIFGILVKKKMLKIIRRNKKFTKALSYFFSYQDIIAIPVTTYTPTQPNQLSHHRSSRWHMFFQIGVRKNFAIFRGKHLCWSFF